LFAGWLTFVTVPGYVVTPLLVCVCVRGYAFTGCCCWFRVCRSHARLLDVAVAVVRLLPHFVVWPLPHLLLVFTTRWFIYPHVCSHVTCPVALLLLVVVTLRFALLFTLLLRFTLRLVVLRFVVTFVADVVRCYLLLLPCIVITQLYLRCYVCCVTLLVAVLYVTVCVCGYVTPLFVTFPVYLRLLFDVCYVVVITVIRCCTLLFCCWLVVGLFVARLQRWFIYPVVCRYHRLLTLLRHLPRFIYITLLFGCSRFTRYVRWFRFYTHTLRFPLLFGAHTVVAGLLVVTLCPFVVTLRCYVCPCGCYVYRRCYYVVVAIYVVVRYVYWLLLLLLLRYCHCRFTLRLP